MLSDCKRKYLKKTPPKMTPQQLREIALNYLKRFEASEATFRTMLRRRISLYAVYDKDFDKKEAYRWAEEIVKEFIERKYIDDKRFAEIKTRRYIENCRSPRYILGKLQEKGINKQIATDILEQQAYNPADAAKQLMRRKKIGPYSANTEIRRERREKDLAVLIRAGFDYDLAIELLDADPENSETSF